MDDIDDAVQKIIELAERLRERYVPPTAVGEPQPEEWQPEGHEPPPPKRRARLKEEWREI